METKQWGMDYPVNKSLKSEEEIEMEENHKQYVHCRVYLFVLLSLAIGSFVALIIEGKDFPVTGTIYGMSTECYTHYKSTSINVDYRIAVHPLDEHYNNYDVKVSFADYASHHNGEVVTYDVPRSVKKGHVNLSCLYAIIGSFSAALALFFGCACVILDK